MGSPIRSTFPLGLHWPTLDPFLFCAHHDDRYPAGDGRLGPALPLTGRQLGNDFSGRDGWSMYHGHPVPGFPAHPHRGFETITYVRSGVVDHSDSLGAAARFGQGDVQWVTAGRGIVHAEMFPLLDPGRPNPLEIFQVWLNLPAATKLTDPYFTMLWDNDIPRYEPFEAAGRDAVIRVLVGELAGVHGPKPPPSSWAARGDTDVAIWHISLAPGAAIEVPPAASAATNRSIYLFEGGDVRLDDSDLSAGTGVVLDPLAELRLGAGPLGSEALLLQGKPIGEPVAQHGPFVMNSRAEIQQAFADYEVDRFGGWPWPDDAPTHGNEARRFARLPDGTIELPTS